MNSKVSTKFYDFECIVLNLSRSCIGLDFVNPHCLLKTELTFVDYLGYIWKCWSKFSGDKDMSCIIYGQWINIFQAHKFNEGTLVKFGVTDVANNKIIYIRPPPMLVLHTKLCSSVILGSSGPVYQI